MRKRPASEEEKILFRQTVEQAAPVIAARIRTKNPSANSGGGGLDGSMRKKLQQGGIRPAARLDLHGFTQETAHRALKTFFQQSHKSGVRLTLVITGKGGVLNQMVPRWLKQPGFAGLIAGIEPAHVRHGGAGALYVYLRK
ncbi:MAG TPA: Smr/MutS family protein [Rhizomicrobium sp.]|jgi:DNA-nicking Smr family endonuclease|nr:Smr/MutS family protein [Rhizomicrobium sp.]